MAIGSHQPILLRLDRGSQRQQAKCLRLGSSSVIGQQHNSKQVQSRRKTQREVEGLRTGHSRRVESRLRRFNEEGGWAAAVGMAKARERDKKGRQVR